MNVSIENDEQQKSIAYFMSSLVNVPSLTDGCARTLNTEHTRFARFVVRVACLLACLLTQKELNIEWMHGIHDWWCYVVCSRSHTFVVVKSMELFILHSLLFAQTHSVGFVCDKAIANIMWPMCMYVSKVLFVLKMQKWKKINQRIA